MTFGQLALVLNPHATADSNYRRIQRFFADFSFDAEHFGRLMLALLPQKKDLVVSIDRSNWQLGSFHINILMLSVAYRGIAFPIVWSLLGKAGNSNRSERSALLERFLKLVEPKKIAAVVADREFIGEGWFKDLKAAGLPFYIRIKHNALVGSKGRTRHARMLFESLRVGETKLLPKRCWVYDHRLSLVGVKLDGEYLIIATNAKADHALALYSQRWQIETLFAALKTRGFNLEASHLQHDESLGLQGPNCWPRWLLPLPGRISWASGCMSISPFPSRSMGGSQKVSFVMASTIFSSCCSTFSILALQG
ncbi:MAG: IS4 family transposase [Deinococcota bacterium]|nr:IS4 family transposase [Deinococcota bacterium]